MHHDSDLLFPHRLTRRDFLKMGAASAAALAAPSLARAEDAAPVKFGTGAWTYTLDRSWGKLPEGMKFGLGCGIVVDGQAHQVAQNSTTTIFFPFAAARSTGSPLIHSAISSGAAGSPNWAAGSGQAAASRIAGTIRWAVVVFMMVCVGGGLSTSIGR